MDFIDTIELSTFRSIIVSLICIAIIILGRPGLATGIYLAAIAWTRTVFVGPFVGTWLFLLTMILSGLVCLLKDREGIRIPKNSRWIIMWMLFWWVWLFVFIFLKSSSSDLFVVLKMFLLLIVIPLSFIVIFVQRLEHIKDFSMAYIGTTIFGGLLSLEILNVSISNVLTDPTLFSYNIIRLWIVNYHWFAYAFAISIIFVMTLFHTSKNILWRTILLGIAGICAYFLILLGSKQSIIGLGVSMLVFGIWLATRKRKRQFGTLIMISIFVFVTVTLYQLKPELILRDSANLNEAFDPRANRTELWYEGIKMFFASPIWGDGLASYSYAHNLFIGTLADQGLVGGVFFFGFLIFSLRQSRKVLVSKDASELEIWKMACFCVFIFGLAHGQTSGSVISMTHLYWSALLLWYLNSAPQDLAYRKIRPFSKRIVSPIKFAD